MKKFCVIGAKVTSSVERNWFDVESDAVDHGSTLARKAYKGYGGQPLTLYVVEIKQVIEIGIPEVKTRPPTDADMAEAAASFSEEGEEEGFTPTKTGSRYHRPK
jgi:hypothetical protein